MTDLLYDGMTRVLFDASDRHTFLFYDHGPLKAREGGSESPTPRPKRPVGFTGRERGLYRAPSFGPLGAINGLQDLSRGLNRAY